MYVCISVFSDTRIHFMSVFYSDLASERERHSSSVRQSRKLHSQVKHLGQELGQVKQEKEKVNLGSQTILRWQIRTNMYPSGLIMS